MNKNDLLVIFTKYIITLKNSIIIALKRRKDSGNEVFLFKFLHLMISPKSFLVLVAYHYCKKVDSSHVHT